MTERSLADGERAEGQRENRGAEAQQKQKSTFASHLHWANLRKCRNMCRRTVMIKVAVGVGWGVNQMNRLSELNG